MSFVYCECGGKWQYTAHFNYGYMSQTLWVCDDCGARKKSPSDEVVARLNPSKPETFYEDD